MAVLLSNMKISPPGSALLTESKLEYINLYVQNMLRVCKKKYFSTKTYIVGTQKNRLNETVLLSTRNVKNDW